MADLIIKEILPRLHSDARAVVMEQICAPEAGPLDLADARLTLHTILAKIAGRNQTPSHLYWPSLVSAVALLAATDVKRLQARARAGFSHRELYWALESDMYGFHTGGVTGSRRFSRCLACAIGKPGKCGAGSAAWFCRRRLSTLDTGDLPLGQKSAALRHGVPLLPSRSIGYSLARGLDSAGRPQGRSRKAVAPTPQPEEDKLVSLLDRTTWNAALPRLPCDDEKSQTFVLQAAMLMENIQGMTAEEQYQEVNCACTKRYIGCLKRLAGMDNRARKREQQEEAASSPSLPSMIEVDLQSTGLRRWPDYNFLCGREGDVTMAVELLDNSPCFMNSKTLRWRHEMAPCCYGLPAWHLHPGIVAEETKMVHQQMARSDESSCNLVTIARDSNTTHHSPLSPVACDSVPSCALSETAEEDLIKNPRRVNNAVGRRTKVSIRTLPAGSAGLKITTSVSKRKSRCQARDISPDKHIVSVKLQPDIDLQRNDGLVPASHFLQHPGNARVTDWDQPAAAPVGDTEEWPEICTEWGSIGHLLYQHHEQLQAIEQQAPEHHRQQPWERTDCHSTHSFGSHTAWQQQALVQQQRLQQPHQQHQQAPVLHPHMQQQPPKAYPQLNFSLKEMPSRNTACSTAETLFEPIDGQQPLADGASLLRPSWGPSSTQPHDQQELPQQQGASVQSLLQQHAGSGLQRGDDTASYEPLGVQYSFACNTTVVHPQHAPAIDVHGPKPLDMNDMSSLVHQQQMAIVSQRIFQIQQSLVQQQQVCDWQRQQQQQQWQQQHSSGRPEYRPSRLPSDDMCSVVSPSAIDSAIDSPATASVPISEFMTLSPSPDQGQPNDCATIRNIVTTNYPVTNPMASRDRGSLPHSKLTERVEHMLSFVPDSNEGAENTSDVTPLPTEQDKAPQSAASWDSVSTTGGTEARPAQCDDQGTAWTRACKRTILPAPVAPDSLSNVANAYIDNAMLWDGTFDAGEGEEHRAAQQMMRSTMTMQTQSDRLHYHQQRQTASCSAPFQAQDQATDEYRLTPAVQLSLAGHVRPQFSSNQQAFDSMAGMPSSPSPATPSRSPNLQIFEEYTIDQQYIPGFADPAMCKI